MRTTRLRFTANNFFPNDPHLQISPVLPTYGSRPQADDKPGRCKSLNPLLQAVHRHRGSRKARRNQNNQVGFRWTGRETHSCWEIEVSGSKPRSMVEYTLGGICRVDGRDPYMAAEGRSCDVRFPFGPSCKIQNLAISPAKSTRIPQFISP